MSLTKLCLSASTYGQPVKVVATSTPGTTIHTAQSGTTAGLLDNIYAWATNTSASDVLLTIEYGGTTSPDNKIQRTIPANETVQVLCGQVLQNSLVVKAFAGSANVITIHGFVERIA